MLYKKKRHDWITAWLDYFKVSPWLGFGHDQMTERWPQCQGIDLMSWYRCEIQLGLVDIELFIRHEIISWRETAWKSNTDVVTRATTSALWCSFYCCCDVFLLFSPCFLAHRLRDRQIPHNQPNISEIITMKRKNHNHWGFSGVINDAVMAAAFKPHRRTKRTEMSSDNIDNSIINAALHSSTAVRQFWQLISGR